MKLFEQIYESATRRDFISSLFNRPFVAKTLLELKKESEIVPPIEDLFDFAVETMDQYPIDWVSIKDNKKEAVVEFIDFYKEWKVKKEKDGDIHKMFKQPDFVFLYENALSVFIGVQSFRGMEQACSFDYGGIGTNWAVGNSSEWERQISSFSKPKFVLVYNKLFDGTSAEKKALIKLELGKGDSISAETILQKHKDYNGLTFNNSRTLQKYHITKDMIKDWYNEINLED